MQRVVGWLLDVYIKGSGAVLWVKTEEGRVLRLTDTYAPFFHVEAKGAEAEEEVVYRLSECPEIKTIRIEEKITSLQDLRCKRLIRVETYGTKAFKEVVRNLERQPLIARLYNVDFRHVQRYLFSRLKIEPTSRISLEHNCGMLIKVEKVEEEKEGEEKLEPPPFKMLHIRIDHDSSSRWGRLTGIHASCEGRKEDFIGSSKRAVASFIEYLNHVDSDLLVCQKYDDRDFLLLKDACLNDGVEFRLGRCDDAEQIQLQGSAAGRVVLGDICYGFSQDEWGLAGLMERTRFAFLPMGLATRWLSNRSIDSRNCFELLQRGYAIPKQEYFEEVRNFHELAERDRGGISITPEIGKLHENVAALDFDSQYPSIIVADGLSYEEPRGTSGNGVAGAFQLIPTVIEPWLRRRIRFKRIRNQFPEGSPERRYCEQRIDALKMILVTQYGIAGCCRNRFGNVVAFEEINSRSRDAMLQAKAVADEEGFKVIYGAVDSLFVNRTGSKRQDYERLASKISEVTALPMSLDKHFRLAAFLPLKSDGISSALMRYFGITYGGKVEARGIELRRSDSPEFIRNFQEELIRRILGHGSASYALSEGVRNGVEFAKVAIGAIRTGSISPEQLVIKKRMRKAIGEYTAGVAQKQAALQLLHCGREVEAGEEMQFIYVDRSHVNPNCRIAIPELFQGKYDREAYASLLSDAASTIFSGIGVKFGHKTELKKLDEWF